ncbi:helix-turn-helix transcriptional regulator [Microbacterium album]|uniref:DeoR family transcriptional regulator n=1 Tax=Microbacterium album TaxID=2053191 RepID=A0A917IEG5_9MICO|nr:WYL domain-containing protein [Microbacterium album]GGH38196.1 DeoR family transcriptional regulator [Microbacterium album]
MAQTTSRLLLLLSLLQARREWPGPELAARLAVAPRTLRRDVERLREMGYRIDGAKGPYGGYRLAAGSDLPPLLFDDEQALALAVALRSASVADAGLGEAAARALASLRQVMPGRLRSRMSALAFSTAPDIATPRRAVPSPDVLTTLSAAVRDLAVVRFDYEPAPGPAADGGLHVDGTEHPERLRHAERRRVEPHALVTWRSWWYLLAWDLDREDWRTFRVERIHPRTPTGPRFRPRPIPGADAGRFVAARFRGAERHDEWPCVGTVVLGLRAAAVIPFAGDGVVEDLGGERCRLRVGSWSWVALAAALGRFDATIEEASPAELVDAFAVLAGRFARAAGQTSASVRAQGPGAG